MRPGQVPRAVDIYAEIEALSAELAAIQRAVEERVAAQRVEELSLERREGEATWISGGYQRKIRLGDVISRADPPDLRGRLDDAWRCLSDGELHRMEAEWAQDGMENGAEIEAEYNAVQDPSDDGQADI